MTLTWRKMATLSLLSLSLAICWCTIEFSPLNVEGLDIWNWLSHVSCSCGCAEKKSPRGSYAQSRFGHVVWNCGVHPLLGSSPLASLLHTWYPDAQPSLSATLRRGTKRADVPLLAEVECLKEANYRGRVQLDDDTQICYFFVLWA